MTAPQDIARSWRLPVDLAHEPTGAEGVGAALWSWRGFGRREFEARTDRKHAILALMERGSARVTHYQDGRLIHDRRVEAGMFNLIPRGREFRSVVSDPQLSLFHLYLPQAMVRSVGAEAGLDAGGLELVNRSVRRDAVVARLARMALEELRTPAIGSRLWFEGVSLQLVVHVARHYSTLNPGRPERWVGGLTQPMLRRAIEVMRDRLAEDVGLAALADEVGLSRFHFSRAFKQSTGLSPQQYQVVLRTEVAQQLLERTTLPVAEIGLRVGYSTPQAFVRAFGRSTGVTPARWRKQGRPDG